MATTVTRGPRPLRAAIASSSYLTRVALRELLAAIPGVSVVAVCDHGDRLLSAATQGVDVVVTDLDLPPSGDGEGLRISKALAQLEPGVGLVVLSERDGGAAAIALFDDSRTGRAVLVKERLRPGPQLETAIRAVAAGDSWFDPATANQLVHRSGLGRSSPLGRLSPRERQVLAAIAQGKSNAAIAEELVLTKRAVEKHVGSIFSKLGLPAEDLVSRRVAAVLVYLGQSGD